MKTRKPNARGNRFGTAAVEFALVAPLFLMLLFGIIEIGRMVMVQQQLTAAVRDGARVAIIDGQTSDEVVAAVENHLAANGVSNADVTISENNIANVLHGQPITVNVSVAFDDVSWIPAPFFLGDVTLTSTCSMRKETPH